jgi:hypothetical protein
VTRAGLHRLDGRTGVSGHVELGNDLDAASLRRRDDLDEVGARQEARARGIGVRAGAELRQEARLLLEIVAAPGADARELGQARDLEAPALVVGQVQVQRVELVRRHLVEDLQHLCLGVEVARQVELRTSVPVPRSVVRDRHLGQRHVP